jgi:hypothetical protein
MERRSGQRHCGGIDPPSVIKLDIRCGGFMINDIVMVINQQSFMVVEPESGGFRVNYIVKVINQQSLTWMERNSGIEMVYSIVKVINQQSFIAMEPKSGGFMERKSSDTTKKQVCMCIYITSMTDSIFH